MEKLQIVSVISRVLSNKSVFFTTEFFDAHAF